MRRAPIVLSATAFGTAAVLGFHAHEAPAPADSAGATASASSASGGTTARASKATGGTSALGDAEQTRYGPAQVRVTISNGKIVKVEAVELQAGDPKSQQISSYAAPILAQSVLERQTAAVDTVSGATYTSLSYEASLQSALDKAGFKAADGSTASTDVSQLG
jgi:uncharacterized protein with FMN-binding domain